MRSGTHITTQAAAISRFFLFQQKKLFRALLIPCICGGHLDLVELLISKGADLGCLPDAVSEKGQGEDRGFSYTVEGDVAGSQANLFMYDIPHVGLWEVISALRR
jgi:hypothetical protein